MTDTGWIVVAAEVRSFGTTLRLAHIAVEPLETKVLPIGTRDVLAIRKAIESSARQEGYTQLEISGYRKSESLDFLERRLA